ncbi:hypothetical protein MTR67_022766 [Solanum verrucosum]|uniref:Uncharacterized protein n=1 Tax=Solanum verrucosum TaxID=315347 RepID=A0AAF0QZJ9_SOLVR|nr:hypothetical protein MTR67_022766 [Solanum verrucosum]
MVSTTLLPRDGSHSTLTQRGTLLAYCVIFGIKLYLSSFILSAMADVISEPSSLSFGMFITCILESHFIFLSDISPIFIKKSYDSRAFVSMGYSHTDSSWVLKNDTEDVAAKNLKSKPSSFTSVSFAILNATLENLTDMNAKLDVVSITVTQVINMVEVTIYFHHGVNKYINKLGFVGVQELIILAPTGKYFEIIGDEGVRTLTSFISTEYKSIHLFATEDCELSVNVTDIVMHDGSFLLSPIVNEGTNCSESEDDNNNGMVFSCSDYATDELDNFVTKKKRNITDSLQDYKEIVKGMAFKDIAEAKQICKLYALVKKVELVVVKSDKKRLSVKTLVDHIECGTAYDNSLVDYSTIALYFKDKLQTDPKYKVKEMKADLHRVFEINVSEANCKRVKKEVLESLEGSFVDSYNKLEGYATELRSCNTGSDIMIDLSVEALSNGQITDRDSCPWIDAPKAQLQSRLTVDQHGSSFDAREEAALAVYKHKLQPVRGEPFWKCDSLHAIEPPKLFKLVGKPKLMREREKDEVVKRQGGKKRQLRRGLVDEYEASEEDINCIALQPTQESQFEYASSSSYFSVAEDDDEDPRLRPRTISEEAFLTRLRKRQNPQEPIGSRVIGFKGDKFGVSEPTNLPIGPTGLTWNGQSAVTTNQLQKLRPRRG